MDKSARRQPTVEALESRILYSADPAPVVIAGEMATVLVQALAPSTDRTATSDPISVTENAASIRSNDIGDASASANSPRELIVLDLRLTDVASLVTDLREQQAGGRNLELVLVDGDDNGIDAVTDAIAAAARNANPYDAIHLLSHGTPGQLQLGASTVSIDTVRSQAGVLASWSEGLNRDADLLLYGCDFAATDDGVALLEALASLTGADVAASTNLTGAAALGGDWVLEQQTGSIEARAALSVVEQQRYAGLLSISLSGTDARANTVTAGSQQTSVNHAGPQVATNASGNAVVVWEDSASGTIKGRLFDATGTAVGLEFQVNTSTGGARTQPTVVMDNIGNFGVVWTDPNSDGSGSGVYGRIFSAAAIGGAEIRLNQTVALDQSNASIALNPLGGFAAIWTSQSAAGLDVKFRSFDGSGAPIINELTVNTYATGDQFGSAFAFRPDGSAIVVWQSALQDGSGYGIFGQLIGAVGAKQGAEFQVNANAALNQTNPDVDTDGLGNFVVVWTTDAAVPGDGTDIHLRRFDNLANPNGLEFQVNARTEGQQDNASIAMDGSGEFIVAWQDHRSGSWVTMASEFDASGSPMTADLQVNQAVVGEQHYPSVVVSGSRAVFTWSGNGPGDVSGVYLRAANINGAGIVVPRSDLTTDENGGSATISVTLASAPTNAVTIPLTVSDTSAGGLSQSSIIFTPGNWNVPVVITVTGRSDGIVTADRRYVVQLGPAISADSAYSGLRGADVVITNINTDSSNTIVVTADTDALDGNVSSIAALLADMGADSRISIREAILASNATANGLLADRIAFNIPGAGVHTINVASGLPTITQALTIDGFSQPGATANSSANSDNSINLIEFQGSLAGAVTHGLSIASDNVSVSGLTINRFQGHGIYVVGDNNVLIGNHIGTSADGLTALGNLLDGLRINGNNNRIGGANSAERNVVSGNQANGIGLYYGSGNGVLGNLIGVGSSGATLLGNGSAGVAIDGAGSNNNTIGGAGAARNIIAGNNRGITVAAGSGTDIAQNPIYNSTFNGIDLGWDGDTPNDPGDGDSGPNGLQNFPNALSAFSDGVNLTTLVALDSTANTNFRIEIFASSTAIVGAPGIAQRFLNSFVAGTDALGNYSAMTTRMAAVAAGEYLTFTATNLTTHETSELSTNIAVTAPPSAPVITIPLSFGVGEDTPVPLDSVSVNDVDLDLSSLALSVTNGTLNFGLPAGVTVVAGAIGTSSVTLSGSHYPLTTIFASLVYQANSDFAGTDSLSVAAMDSTGLIDSRSAPITINAVNDPPTIVLPAAQSTAENTALTLAGGNAISINDADSAANPIRLTLTATNGQLSLAGTTGLSFQVGSGSNDFSMTFTASQVDVNAALDGLIYRANPGFSGADTLTVVLDDQGNTGSGGAKTDTQFVTLTVSAVNNPPVLLLPAAQTLLEDGTLVFIGKNGNPITITDSDSISTPIRVHLQADHGRLSLASQSGLSFAPASANDSASLDFTGRLTDIQAALLRLSLAGDSDYYGPLSVTIAVDDLGGAGVGSTVTVAGALLVTVTPVNDAPVISANAPIDMNDIKASTVGVGALTASDVDNSQSALIYTLRENLAGFRLQLNGNELLLGDRFNQADINSGKLSLIRIDTGAGGGALRLDLSDSSGGTVDKVQIKVVSRLIIAPTATTDSAPGSGGGDPKIDGIKTTTPSGTVIPPSSSPASVSDGATQNIRVSGKGGTAPLPVLIPTGPTTGTGERGALGFMRHDQAGSGSSNGNRTDLLRGSLLQFDARRPINHVVLQSAAHQDQIGSPVHAAFRKLAAQELVGSVRERIGERIVADRNFAASSVAVSAGVSIGYVIWLIRGGVLLSSVLATVPAWSAIDPLPVLSHVGGKGKGDGEDDSLQAMLSKAKTPTPDKPAIPGSAPEPDPEQQVT